MVTAGLFEPSLASSPEDIVMVCVSFHQKVDGFWNADTIKVWPDRPGIQGLEVGTRGSWRRRKGGYPSCEESWETELSHKFLSEPPPRFTLVLSQQGSRQQGSLRELCKVSLAGWGVLLAGTEKTFLVSLTLADMTTTVLTSCSYNKVLSSRRGDVRSDFWWAGFLLLVCFV